MKNFINLNYSEKLLVLEWRNSQRVRENMYSTKIISVENHLNFIDKLIYDRENKYFLVEDIGVIYFNNIKNNSVNIGLYSNPKKYGVGRLLMNQILSFDFKYYYLEVFKNNKKAIDLYLKYNFKIKNEDKNIIYMELKNENS